MAPKARRSYLVPIAGPFSAVLIVSLILAGKIVSVGGVTFTAAVIVFPLSYLFGNVLTEVYGFASTRRVVWAGFAAQIIWIVSYWIPRPCRPRRSGRISRPSRPCSAPGRGSRSPG